VIGIDQTPAIPKEPEYLAQDFDPFDPHQKYNETHYLTGLEHMTVDMQMSNQTIRMWATSTAKQLLSELNERTIVRNKAKALMVQNFTYLQQPGGHKNEQFDQSQYTQRRIEYWDYIRSSI